MKLRIILPAALTYFACAAALGWGGRGHNSICEAAVHLVKNPELREFLQFKPHVMGHLCNVPDIYWKSLSSEARKLGDTAHYINAEKLGLKIADIPTDYRKIVEDFTGKPNKENTAKTIYSIPDELGSSWWRADQFYRLAVEAGKKAQPAASPKDFKEEQNNDLPYNKGIYDMMVNLGLMGHFVGDNSQPFHCTSDHDGYASGHGGIHAFYEEAVVAQFGADLIGRIVKQARSLKNPAFVKKDNVIENMRALSEASYGDLKDVLKADVLVKPSTLNIDKGMSLKTPAQRRSAENAFKRMEKLVLKQLSRSSLLLAHLWDAAYVEAGQPQLKPYKSYLHPFTPEFVKPDYYTLPATK
jgi:hypothetical protein